MRRHALPLLAFLVAAGAPAAAVAQATPPATATPTTPAATRRPLEPFAQREVLVMPAQRIADGDTAGWAAGLADQRGALATLDAELQFALQGRRGIGKWRFADEVVRLAKRAAPYAPDPQDLAVDFLTGAIGEKTRYAPGPLAASLRTLGGLSDGRWALIPIQLRHDGPAAAGHLVLRAAFVDVRAGEVGWVGDVPGDAAPLGSPRLLASVAQRLADLIVAP